MTLTDPCLCVGSGAQEVNVLLRVYALAPETLRRLLRQMILRLLGYTTLSFFLFGVYLALFGGPVRWELALPVTVIIGLAYFLILFSAYRQQLRWLYSVRYEIGASSITLRQRNHAPLTVMRANISGVEGRADGLHIHVLGVEPGMFIPYGLAKDGDEAVRATLGMWTGDRPRPFPGRKGRAQAVWLGLGGSLLVLLFANQLELIIPLGVVALGFGIYTERRMNAKPENDPGKVRTYSAAFTFLIFIIAMKACLISLSMMLSR